MTKLIIGAFPDRREANEAILELEEAGMPQDDFSIIAQAEEAEASSLSNTPGKSMAGKTAGDGAAVGSVAGGLAGLIAGAATTAGMFVAGPFVLLAGLGWIALTTVTGGAVGATAGGIMGSLIGLGVPEDAARHHESIIKAGGILLGAEDNAVSEHEIRECFEHHSAEQVAVIEHQSISARVAHAVV